MNFRSVVSFQLDRVGFPKDEYSLVTIDESVDGWRFGLPALASFWKESGKQEP